MSSSARASEAESETVVYEGDEAEDDDDDVDELENRLLEADEESREDPLAGVVLYKSLLHNSKKLPPSILFAARVELTALLCRLGQHDAMKECLLLLISIGATVYLNKMTKAINRLLGLVVELNSADLSINTYRLVISALEMTDFKALWFSSCIRLCRLHIDSNDFTSVEAMMTSLKAWCANDQGGYDTSKSAHTLDLIYLEALTTKEINETVVHLHSRMLECVRTVAVADPRIVGLVKELYGRYLLTTGDWDAAFHALHDAYALHEQGGSERRKECLKLLLCISMVLFKTMDPLAVRLESPTGRTVDEGKVMDISRSLQAGQRHAHDAVVETLAIDALAKPNLISLLYAARQRVSQRLAYDQYWTVVNLVARDWLDVPSLILLDKATLNRSCRTYLLDYITNTMPYSAALKSPSLRVSNTQFKWLLRRQCSLTYLTLAPSTNLICCLVSGDGAALNTLQSLRLRDLKVAKSLFEHCTSLLSLDLERSSTVEDGTLEVIGRSCPNLRHLFIGSCKDYTDRGLTFIANGCRQLQTLDISYCGRVSDAGIVSIAKTCTELHTLNLASSHVSNISMSALAENSHSLRKINLQRSRVDDQGIMELTNSLVNLEDVFLSFSCSDLAVEAVTRNCRDRLQRINCTPRVTDAGLRLIADRCPNLTSIDAEGGDLSSAAFMYLADRIPSLTSLKLSSSITDTTFIHFAERCSGLVLLHLSDDFSSAFTDDFSSAITDASLNSLTQFCPQLQSLELNRCILLSTDAIVHLIETCTQLTRLSLFGCSVNPLTVMNSIAEHSNQLAFLNLSHIPQMTDVNEDDLAAVLSKCPNLKYVFLDKRLYQQYEKLNRLQSDFSVKILNHNCAAGIDLLETD